MRHLGTLFPLLMTSIECFSYIGKDYGIARNRPSPFRTMSRSAADAVRYDGSSSVAEGDDTTTASAFTTSTTAAATTAAATTTAANAATGGVLSFTFPELADYLGGVGRAKMVLDCYKRGIDPIEYYSAPPPCTPSSAPPCTPPPPSMDHHHHQSHHRNGAVGGPRLGVTAMRRLTPLRDVATLSHTSIARDGTTKLLLTLRDGQQIETVIIPWNDTRSSLCISSQVGCRQGCVFCATGKMGIRRNLTADEIIVQMITAVRVVKGSDHLPTINSVVFMGKCISSNATNTTKPKKIIYICDNVNVKYSCGKRKGKKKNQRKKGLTPTKLFLNEQ